MYIVNKYLPLHVGITFWMTLHMLGNFMYFLSSAFSQNNSFKNTIMASNNLPKPRVESHLGPSCFKRFSAGKKSRH